VQVIKIWGRNTSSNVQKAMWAVGELSLEHQRNDIGGPFGQNREPKYLAMNPNGLVPTLEEEDGFLLWESNSVVRYLAAKYDKTAVLEPKDAKQRGLASQWMDWQLSVAGPAITPAFWGLIRTPPEKRDMAAIKASQEKTVEAMKILDALAGKLLGQAMLPATQLERMGGAVRQRQFGAERPAPHDR
jgi:glutathione S-transferase